MFTLRKIILASFTFVVFSLAYSAAASDESIKVMLINPVQSAAPGAKLTFRGKFINSTSADAHQETVGAGNDLRFCDIDFAPSPAVVPAFTTDNADEIDLFFITIKPDTPVGTVFNDSYSVNYRSQLTGELIYSQAEYQITVEPAVVP